MVLFGLRGALAFAILLAGCAQFIAPSFSQEGMAHSASIGTMYLTSANVNGSHNCDDTPSNCCASGYHMCSISEFLNGGREIEDSGTGRDATPVNTAGFTDPFANSALYDCNGWSSNSSGSSTKCSYDVQGGSSGKEFTCAQDGSNACNNADLEPVWCCSS